MNPYNGTQFSDPAKLDTHGYRPEAWPDGLAQETCRENGNLPARHEGARLIFGANGLRILESGNIFDLRGKKAINRP